MLDEDLSSLKVERCKTGRGIGSFRISLMVAWNTASFCLSYNAEYLGKDQEKNGTLPTPTTKPCTPKRQNLHIGLHFDFDIKV